MCVCVSGLRGVLAVPRRSDKLLKEEIRYCTCAAQKKGAGVRQAPYSLVLCNVNDTYLAEEKSKLEKRSSVGIRSSACDTGENQELLH